MFDVATRTKLRFETAVGLLSVEDLWDLPLSSVNGRPNLNDIAVALHHQMKEAAEVTSFVDDSAKPDETIQLRFDIVKHIIDAKKADREERAASARKAELKRQLLEIVDRKQNQGLEALSLEELQAKIAAL